MHVAGVIITGGQAQRMGTDKRFVELGGRSLLDRVIDRVRPQVDLLALGIGHAPREMFQERYGDAYTLIPDPPGKSAGPLSGLLAALTWAAAWHDAGVLVTFPGDTPFLPRDLVAQLIKSMSGAQAPVVARSSQGIESLCALWPVELCEKLQARFASVSDRSLWRLLDDFGAIPCAFNAPEAFLNINTPADLTRAEQLLSSM